MTQAAATAEPRTLAPPERRVATVVGNEVLGAYRLIAAEDPDGPADPRPGQFYMLAGGGAVGWGSRRAAVPAACVLVRARPAGERGVRLEFLLEDIGPGTGASPPSRRARAWHWWARSGSAFGPRSRTRPLLVGGGIGTAPLLCLSEELEAPRVLLGFRSADHAEAARPSRTPASPPTTARPGAGRSSRSCWARSSNRAPPRSSPAARRRCSRRSGHVRRARGAGPAGARSGHGLRLRRLLRLRGAYPRGLPPVSRRPGSRLDCLEPRS